MNVVVVVSLHCTVVWLLWLLSVVVVVGCSIACEGVRFKHEMIIIIALACT